MTACPHCGAQLETPLGCGACQVPLEVATCIAPFVALGLAPSVPLDAEDLKAKHLKVAVGAALDVVEQVEDLDAALATALGD